MSLRSPLGVVLGRGAAGEGAAHWWAQRVSAVALALLGPWFAVSLLQLDDTARDAVLAWMGDPLHSVLLTILIVTLAYHSRLGVQVVVEDYVHHKGYKIVTMLIVNFAHVVLAALGAFAVLRVAFGAAA